MKKSTFVKWFLLGMYTLGCMDLDLLDDMRSSDGGVPTLSENSTKTEGGNGVPIPEADPTDEIAPNILTSVCREPARLENDICVVEGPISASMRFITDEAATVTLSAQSRADFVSLSEPWSTEHYMVMGVDGVPAQYRIDVSDFNGNTTTAEVTLTGSSGSPVVITEILADPLGAEPAQEYIEVKNLGDDIVDLSGWMIDDNGDRDGDLIPEGTVLSPETVGLIVSDTYNTTSGVDTKPDIKALIIRVNGSLVSNGLKNSVAESVELYDVSGQMVDRYDGSVSLGAEGEALHRHHERIPPLDPNAFGELKPATPGKCP